MIISLLIASAIPMGLGSLIEAQQKPPTNSPYKVVVVATSTDTTDSSAKLVKVFDRAQLAEEAAKFGFAVWSQDEAAVVYGKGFLNADNLRNKTKAVQVMLSAVQSGKKTIALDDLSSEDADAVRSAMIANQWIQPNEAPLLFGKGFKFACIPSATVTLGDGNKSVSVPIPPGQFGQEMEIRGADAEAAADPDGKFSKRYSEILSRLGDKPIKSLTFEFSRTKMTVADKAKTVAAFMAAYSEELDKLQRAYVELCGALASAIRASIGDPVQESGLAAGVGLSNVKDPVGKALSGQISGGWNRFGFSDGAAAEAFLGRAVVNSVTPCFFIEVPGVKPLGSHASPIFF